jgi:D-glycero-alpha-D-manno-heptose-7-phosphate kinase
MVKRGMASGVSTLQIDEWYERARANGALGGKISGAGGGGFLMLFAPRHAHAAICRALPELRPVPILLEPQGSKIIYVEESARD